jgi:hypothetical protein
MEKAVSRPNEMLLKAYGSGMLHKAKTMNTSDGLDLLSRFSF